LQAEFIGRPKEGCLLSWSFNSKTTINQQLKG
jgi:hypothetical protein